MKESLITKGVTRVLVGILILFMCSILLRQGVEKVLVKGLGMDNGFTRFIQFDGRSQDSDTPEEMDGVKEVSIDWEQLYPFEEKAGDAEDESKGKTSEGIWKKVGDKTSELKEKIIDAEKKIELQTNNRLLFHDQWVLYANAYEKAINWEIDEVEGYNNLITVEKGYLASYVPYVNTEPILPMLKPFLSFLQEREIPFLYVQAPGKICVEDTKVSGVVDFSNKKADELLSRLEEADVNTLDLRASLHDEGRDHHEMFYKTDHHWKAETGLWAAGLIAERLNREMGFSIDTSLYRKDWYDYEVYEDWFLGSQGKKVTLIRADPEDISLIYPKFETNLTLEIPSYGIDKTGDFDVLYFYSVIKKKDFYRESPYGAYFYADTAVKKVTNHLAKNDDRVLVIADSFANSMSPFLSLGVRNLEAIDVRFFTGSIQSYIKQNEFDAVILMYNASMLLPDEMFELG